VLPILLILAQEGTPVPTGDVLKYLGPFVVFAVPTLFWIRDLQLRVRESTKREQLLSDRLVELAERALPVLTQVAEELPKVVKELERRELRREK